jgi:glycosyltransferase involved in cell wall biosynthesis
MKILFLTSCQKPIDGWSIVGCNVVKSFKNCDIEVFSGEQKGIFKFGVTRLKSEFYDRYKLLTVVFDVVNILLFMKEKPNLIHCNVEYYAPVALILSKIYNIPYTITAHGTYGVLLPSKYKLYKKSFEQADIVIAVSNYTKSRMTEEGIDSNFTVILNGVDKSIFHPEPLQNKQKKILFVGNLKPRKGLTFLLESLCQAYKINRDIELLVIGEVDHSSKQYFKVREYIDDNGLNVDFLGRVSENDLATLYRTSMLNILPSKSEPFYFEGFGLIHLEANACGTLTVGTINSGNEDAIDKKNGFLIQYGDVHKLSSIISSVFSANKYRELNLDDIKDWSEVSNQYVDVFNRLIEKSIKTRLKNP